MNRALILVLSLAAATAAPAQSVWRCGPDGRVFQATPCADGRTMDLRPAPPPAAVQEAHKVAQREKLALQALAEERQAREREARDRGYAPAAIKPAPKATAQDSRPRRPKKLPPWVLPGPAA